MRLLPVVLLVVASGCGGADWKVVDAAALHPEQQLQRQRAVEARDAMFQQLLLKLTGAIAADGPAAAIGVCSVAAPAIAADVAERFALRIGRTSDRLRNAANTAPAWAVPALEGRPTGPVFRAGPGGELGVVLPILLQPPCMQCHGPRETLAADVRARLDEHYPHDEAVGYAVGDLRGWFWVEVPR